MYYITVPMCGRNVRHICFQILIFTIPYDFFANFNIIFIYFVFSRGRSKLPSHLLHRRHSRASSVDRREIFNKYIQRPGEHSDSVKPFVSDDPELCHGEKDRNQDEFLMDPNR